MTKSKISGELLVNLSKLANGLRDKGFTKEARSLEEKIRNYKTAEIHLYRVFEETGEGLVDFAHPEGDVMMGPSVSGYGIVETQNTQHDKIIDVINKVPDGKLASKTEDLVKMAGLVLGIEKEGQKSSWKYYEDSLKKQRAEVADGVRSILKEKGLEEGDYLGITVWQEVEEGLRKLWENGYPIDKFGAVFISEFMNIMTPTEAISDVERDFSEIFNKLKEAKDITVKKLSVPQATPEQQKEMGKSTERINMMAKYWGSGNPVSQQQLNSKIIIPMNTAKKAAGTLLSSGKITLEEVNKLTEVQNIADSIVNKVTSAIVNYGTDYNGDKYVPFLAIIDLLGEEYKGNTTIEQLFANLDINWIRPVYSWLTSLQKKYKVSNLNIENIKTAQPKFTLPAAEPKPATPAPESGIALEPKVPAKSQKMVSTPFNTDVANMQEALVRLGDVIVTKQTYLLKLLPELKVSEIDRLLKDTRGTKLHTGEKFYDGLWGIRTDKAVVEANKLIDALNKKFGVEISKKLQTARSSAKVNIPIIQMLEDKIHNEFRASVAGKYVAEIVLYNKTYKISDRHLNSLNDMLEFLYERGLDKYIKGKPSELLIKEKLPGGMTVSPEGIGGASKEKTSNIVGNAVEKLAQPSQNLGTTIGPGPLAMVKEPELQEIGQIGFTYGQWIKALKDIFAALEAKLDSLTISEEEKPIYFQLMRMISARSRDLNNLVQSQKTPGQAVMREQIVDLSPSAHQKAGIRHPSLFGDVSGKAKSRRLDLGMEGEEYGFDEASRPDLVSWLDDDPFGEFLNLNSSFWQYVDTKGATDWVRNVFGGGISRSQLRSATGSIGALRQYMDALDAKVDLKSIYSTRTTDQAFLFVLKQLNYIIVTAYSYLVGSLPERADQRIKFKLQRTQSEVAQWSAVIRGLENTLTAR